MSDVFVSYKRQDTDRVAALAHGLRASGLSVWLDVDTPGGASWRQEILERLDRAGCVVVVWSEASVGPEAAFVHDEASRALRRGVLLPLRIDEVEPPIGFGEVQALDLVGWDGDPEDPRFQDVAATVRAILDGAVRPAPRGPTRRKRLVAGLGTAAVVVAACLGFVADVAGLQGAICRVPGVRTLCGAAGWGGVPSEAEETLWSSRAPGDCESLGRYLSRFPDGAYADQAQRLLQAASTETEEEWTPAERWLPLTVRVGGEPQSTEELAREEALRRGHDDAQLICRGFDGGEFRLVEAEPSADRWRCSERPDGIVCGFDGSALCQVEERRVAAVEKCP